VKSAKKDKNLQPLPPASKHLVKEVFSFSQPFDSQFARDLAKNANVFGNNVTDLIELDDTLTTPMYNLKTQNQFSPFCNTSDSQINEPSQLEAPEVSLSDQPSCSLTAPGTPTGAPLFESQEVFEFGVKTRSQRANIRASTQKNESQGKRLKIT